jgi:hypothetical protein
MKIYYPLASACFLLQLAACNRPPSCRDCEGEDLAGEGEEEGVMPDLPCGGANLQTDDFNCGSCGNACVVDWPGTRYAAGGCVDGECGRNWSALHSLSAPPAMETCEQLCSFGDFSCVPGGCSGLTAYVCVTLGDFGDQCNLGDPLNLAFTEMTGACDEVIPYPTDFVENADNFVFVDYACCCGP